MVLIGMGRTSNSIRKINASNKRHEIPVENHETNIRRTFSPNLTIISHPNFVRSLKIQDDGSFFLSKYYEMTHDLSTIGNVIHEWNLKWNISNLYVLIEIINGDAILHQWPFGLLHSLCLHFIFFIQIKFWLQLHRWKILVIDERRG